jgi:hypothetical protein
MAKHQALSARSRRTRALLGGVMAGGVLALAAPAGLAFADTPGDTVGRPTLGNPAPGVRAAQAVGDATFNNDTPLGTAINGSPLGDAYHKAFGQRGTPILDSDGNVIGYNQDGTPGYIKGALNAPPGIVVGNAIPLKECNIKVASGSLIPTGIQGGNC